LELTVNVPPTDPELLGAKVTLKLTLCPGLSVAGGLIPLYEYPVPLPAMFEIVMAALSEFVSVSCKVFELETATPLKLNVAGLAVRDPVPLPPVP
jgi:hypothetical protein